MMQTIKQRFSDNVIGNPNRGRGEEHLKNKNYKYPTQSQINKFQKYDIPFDVDVALRDVIIKLNEVGYTTLGSCQGHSKSNTAFISIAIDRSEIPKSYSPLVISRIFGGKFSHKKINVSEIKTILSKYGITNTIYSPPSLPKVLPKSLSAIISKGFQQYHAFTFPIIFDELPSKQEIIYWYKSPKTGLAEHTIFGHVPPEEFHSLKHTAVSNKKGGSHQEILDNGKVIWSRDTFSKDSRDCNNIKISLELHKVIYKALNIPYNEKKVSSEIFTKKELKKCKIG